MNTIYNTSVLQYMNTPVLQYMNTTIQQYTTSLLSPNMKQFIKSKYDTLKPKVLKGITNTVQGYLFGCMIGVFTKTPSVQNIHKTGKDIAKVCAVYSITETVIDTCRNNDDIVNKYLAGTITGMVCSKTRFMSIGTVYGGAGLGLYTVLNRK